MPHALDQIGYDFWAENPKPDRLFFVKGMPPRGTQRTHHVHVCQMQSEMWVRLKFRDYLRRHPEDAEAYAALKSELAARHGQDREAYTDAKNDFVHRIMQIAAAR